MKKFVLALLLCSGAVWGVTQANASTVDEVKLVTVLDPVSSLVTWNPYFGTEGSPAYFPVSYNLSVQSYTAVELTDPNTGSPSDYIWYQAFGTIGFVSDNNGSFSGLPTLNVVATLTETGAFQNVGQYFGLQDDYIQVKSGDVSATPIPATLPLFTTGLGALGLLGWRRKRKAAALAT